MHPTLPLALLALTVSACAPDHSGYWISDRGPSECAGCRHVELLYFQRDSYAHAGTGLHCAGAVNQLWMLNLSNHRYQLHDTQLLVGRNLENAGTLVVRDDGTLVTDSIARGFDGVYGRPEGDEADAVEALFDLSCHPYWGECWGPEPFGDQPCSTDDDCPLGTCAEDQGICNQPDC